MMLKGVKPGFNRSFIKYVEFSCSFASYPKRYSSLSSSKIVVEVTVDYEFGIIFYLGGIAGLSSIVVITLSFCKLAFFSSPFFLFPLVWYLYISIRSALSVISSETVYPSVIFLGTCNIG
jgi:hypothetical protein